MTKKVKVCLLPLATIAMSSFFSLHPRETVNAFKTFFDNPMIP